MQLVEKGGEESLPGAGGQSKATIAEGNHLTATYSSRER